MCVVESGLGGAKDKASPNWDASDSDEFFRPSSDESSNAAKDDKNGDPEPSGSAVTLSESNESGDAGDLPPEGFRGLRFDSSSDLEDPPSDSEELLHYTSTGSKELDEGWIDEIMKKLSESENKEYHTDKKSYHSPKNKKYHSQKRVYQSEEDSYLRPAKRYHSHEKTYTSSKKSYDDKGKSHGKHKKLSYDEIMKKSSKSYEKAYNSEEQMYGTY